MPPQLVSLNVGSCRVIDHQGRTVETGIWKQPVPGPMAVDTLGLSDDVQADTRAHGGPDKALYAYSTEDYQWWELQLGRTTEPGLFGENLTVSELDVTGSAIGDRWLIGTAVLEVAEPRLPCFKLGLRMNEPKFSRRFVSAGKPGAYLRVVEPGSVQQGDPIETRPTSEPPLTIGDVFRIYEGERHRAGELLEVTGLSPAWQAWARRTLELRARHGL